MEAQVDLDLAEMRSDPRVGLLRLARPLTQGWNSKNLQVLVAGENSPPEALPNQTFEITIDNIDGKFTKLREFVTAAVLTIGQNYAPLLQPLTHDGGAVQTCKLSSDARLVLTLGYDGIVRLWDSTTAQPIVPPLQPRATRRRRDNNQAIGKVLLRLHCVFQISTVSTCVRDQAEALSGRSTKRWTILKHPLTSLSVFIFGL